MTIMNWIPRFTNLDIIMELPSSIRFTQKERGIVLYVWGVGTQSASDLRQTIKEFKSYTARTIIDYLKQGRPITLY